MKEISGTILQVMQFLKATYHMSDTDLEFITSITELAYKQGKIDAQREIMEDIKKI